MEAIALQETEGILRCLDIDYAHDLARRMERFRSNPTLGYRPAGSEAARQTGDMLAREMRSLGLQNVRKDAVRVDGWEFRGASLAFDTPGGRWEACLGAYQTTLVTHGWETCRLVYLGQGRARDYEGRDVRGKLVLVDINQREDWWINFPAYQAHVKGARALIAVQRGGFGEVDDAALNAQDIAGPADAPAFSIARRDADALLACLDPSGEAVVSFQADTRVIRDATDYNIVGEIPGRHPERMVLLSAHYDSYFSGFQDDNAAIALMLGIARAFRRSGYQPCCTLVFCAMAAEEWGVTDSWFDWSTGAYEQVFTVHPEWAGKVIADVNFELPAVAHGTRARIRSCYEYTCFLETFLAHLPPLTPAFPDAAAVTAPIETMSDDFSMAIAGIPSMVNDFTGGSFMKTHYHSQLDMEATYDAAVYRLHHELFTLLVWALDRTCVAPLCLTPVLRRALARLPEDPDLAAAMAPMRAALQRAVQATDAAWGQVQDINRRYAQLLDAGQAAEAEALYQRSRAREAALLARFKREQDILVRLDWGGSAAYPHELALDDIERLTAAAEALRAGDRETALHWLCQVDNNRYAISFDEAVCRHFTDYMTEQPRRRLKWGWGRLMPHLGLQGVVRSLARGHGDCAGELAAVEEAIRARRAWLQRVMAEITEFANELGEESGDIRR